MTKYELIDHLIGDTLNPSEKTNLQRFGVGGLKLTREQIFNTAGKILCNFLKCRGRKSFVSARLKVGKGSSRDAAYFTHFGNVHTSAFAQSLNSVINFGHNKTPVLTIK